MISSYAVRTAATNRTCIIEEHEEIGPHVDAQGCTVSPTYKRVIKRADGDGDVDLSEFLFEDDADLPEILGTAQKLYTPQEFIDLMRHLAHRSRSKLSTMSSMAR